MAVKCVWALHHYSQPHMRPLLSPASKDWICIHLQNYSPETHRALIALRYAKHSRPINSILDDDYRTEVEILCPGTTLPHSTTVQRDLINIYIHMSTFVMNYFMVKLTLLYCFGGKLNNISRHLVLLCILHWMDGQVPLLLPTLGLLSSGMQMVQ